ncbi:MAG TPA: methylenetetrahydrofolate reductase [Thermoleophilaceae bacterium]|jgi:methylenetetrahydrofolate reductase (NADPH)
MAKLDQARFEVLPLGRSEEEAAQLRDPVRLTVTCSPKHGPDRTVEVAGRLHALGHPVTAHIAARMVRSRAHLDSILGGMADAGVDDLFLIGGDAEQPLGAYSSAVELLPVVAEHPRRPQTIGIAGYPEGHPLIANEILDNALREKSHFADYVTTQMCFEADAVRTWVARQRERDLTIPVLVGMPGKVARTRLLEMSVRIGVGPSLAFVRKQRGIRALLSRRSTADRLYEELVPMLDDPELNIAGVHFFTFNQLVETWRWQLEKQGEFPRSSPEAAAQGPYVPSEERTA